MNQERLILASVLFAPVLEWPPIRDGELERLEQIIFYNSAMLGGYFNVFIPLTEKDEISEDYQQFLIDYDPDFVGCH